MYGWVGDWGEGDGVGIYALAARGFWSLDVGFFGMYDLLLGVGFVGFNVGGRKRSKQASGCGLWALWGMRAIVCGLIVCMHDRFRGRKGDALRISFHGRINGCMDGWMWFVNRAVVQYRLPLINRHADHMYRCVDFLCNYLPLAHNVPRLLFFLYHGST